MDFNGIMKKMEAERGGSVKTAGAASQEITMTQNTGANDNAVNTLLKVAMDLSGAEKQAELAHAALMGQAVADAAIARFSTYQNEMAKVASVSGGYTESDVEEATRIGYQAGVEAGIKHASEMGSGNAEQEKVAAYFAQGETKLAAAAEVLSTEDLLKFAEQEGLTPVLEKMAEEYEAGYKQAEAEITELARTEFLKGAAETEIMIDLLKQAAGPGIDPAQLDAMKARVNAGKRRAADQTIQDTVKVVPPPPSNLPATTK